MTYRNLNAQQARDLDLRDRVPPLVLSVLQRAEGLELLDYPLDRVEVQFSRGFNEPVPVGARITRLEPLPGGGIEAHYTQVVGVPYPVPGYPEAYDWQ